MALSFNKYFTPAEANNTLPLVKQIVEDILQTGIKVKYLVDSLQNDIEKIQQSSEIEDLSREIRGFMRELEEIGCFYKDWNFEIGLVDFPSVINGREVFLCWRSDEEDLKFYHSIEEGYTGRQEIPESYLISSV